MMFNTMFNASMKELEIANLDQLDELKQYISLEKFEVYTEWAKNTVLAEAVHPLVGKPFADIFEVGMSNEGNYLQITVWPWHEKTTLSATPAGAISALVDAFGTRRYDALMKPRVHMRQFDIDNPFSGGVLTQFEPNQTWQWYGFRNDTFYRQTPSLDTKKGRNWFAKHNELCLMMLALQRGFRYVITPWEDWMVGKFARQIEERLNMKVVDAIAAKQADGVTARKNRAAQRTAQRTAAETLNDELRKDVEPIIDEIDLREIKKPVVVEVLPIGCTTRIQVTVDPNAEDYEEKVAQIKGTMELGNTVSINHK